MSKIKRVLAFILAFTMCLSVSPVTGFAAQVDKAEDAAVVVTIGDATISNTSNYVEVPVSIKFNDADAMVDAIGIQFSFDDKNVVMHTPKDRFDSAVNSGNGALCTNVTASHTEKTATFATSSDYPIDQIAVNYYGTNILFWLRMEAVEGYEAGEYEISASLIDGQPANFAFKSTPVDVYFESGTITLVKPGVTLDDSDVVDGTVTVDGENDVTITPTVVDAEGNTLTDGYTVSVTPESDDVTVDANGNIVVDSKAEEGEYTVTVTVDGT